MVAHKQVNFDRGPNSLIWECQYNNVSGTLKKESRIIIRAGIWNCEILQGF